MVPECYDAYYLKYKSRPDALFYTFPVLGVKILMAFYLGISQFVLSENGFENGICAEFQDERVSKAIIYLYAPITLIFSLLSSFFILFYPINEKVAQSNIKLIQNSTRLLI
jgi:Na+/melibiose symporter-like transporter